MRAFISAIVLGFLLVACGHESGNSTKSYTLSTGQPALLGTITGNPEPSISALSFSLDGETVIELPKTSMASMTLSCDTTVDRLLEGFNLVTRMQLFSYGGTSAGGFRISHWIEGSTVDGQTLEDLGVYKVFCTSEILSPSELIDSAQGSIERNAVLMPGVSDDQLQ